MNLGFLDGALPGMSSGTRSVSPTSAYSIAVKKREPQG
jgi:hypothetical protein